MWVRVTGGARKAGSSDCPALIIFIVLKCEIPYIPLLFLLIYRESPFQTLADSGYRWKSRIT